MKKIRIQLLAATAALLAAAPAAAQTYNGLLLNHGDMSTADMANLARSTQNFGTARSMAMGNAFASLGADMVSLSMNPAGLGMYRSSAISITPLVTSAHASTDGASAYGSNGATRFALSNLGAVLNAYQSPRGLVSLSIGFGYQRVADLNYSYGFSTSGNRSSIGDLFSAQLTWEGLTLDDIRVSEKDNRLAYDRIYPSLWGAAMGYKTGLTDYLGDRTWGASWIGQEAEMGHYVGVRSTGSINEYDLAVGANIDNKFYVGLTIGLQSVDQRLKINYEEDYAYGPGGSGLAGGEMRYADWYQSIRTSGSGINFKLGMIWRPFAGLRIGAAVHSPTFYSLDRSYYTDMLSDVYLHDAEPPRLEEGIAEGPNYALEDFDDNSWDFISPTRMMVGASYAFGNFAIVAVDYERDWYNGIRAKNVPSLSVYRTEDFNADARDLLRATNTLRVGAELRPLPLLALRAGATYTDSILRDEGSILTMPVIDETWTASLGVGVQLSRSTTLDLAYQYQRDSTSEYLLYYGAMDRTEIFSNSYRTSFARHNVVMTLGFRF